MTKYSNHDPFFDQPIDTMSFRELLTRLEAINRIEASLAKEERHIRTLIAQLEKGCSQTAS